VSGQRLRLEETLCRATGFKLPEGRFSRQALARPEEIAPLRTAVWRLALESGASEGVGNAVRVAVSEALTNVVMHAYVGRAPGQVTVEAWLDGTDHLTVLVLDDGHGLIPRADSPGLGLGMGLMAQMADDFRIANREGVSGTTVSLGFLLKAPDRELTLR
jgi:serine/threonine-protein kinase RsbW